MKEFIKKNKYVIFFGIVFVLFFSYAVTITVDSAHYFNYVNIFNGIDSIETWDIVRGPSFPLLIYISTLILGESIFALSLMLFGFYLIFIYSVNELLNNIFLNNKNKIYIVGKNLILLFCILNPIIFGYFHTLLTEFLALSLGILSILLSVKWIYSDFSTTRLKLILQSLLFVFLAVFLWFVKQPYVLLTIAPVAIAAIISIIKYFNLRNVIYKTCTLFIMMISIFVSINLWNGYLSDNNVNMNTGRDSSTILSGSLLTNLDFIEVSDPISSDDEVVDSDLFSDKEKQELKDITSNFLLISIYDAEELVEYDYILLNDEDALSTFSSIGYVMKVFSKKPLNVLSSYLMNHCSSSGLCYTVYETNEGFEFININFSYLYENNVIPYKIYEDGTSNFYLPDYLLANVTNYVTNINPGISHFGFDLMKLPTNFIYKIVVFLAPFLFLLTMVIKVLFYKTKGYITNKLFYITIILLGTATVALAMNAVTGLLIDRYSVGVFIPSFIGFISFVLFIKELIYSIYFYKIIKKK